jgi:O-antigen ligase
MNNPVCSPRRDPPALDEWLVCGHVTLLVGFLAWAYGGQIGWVRALATVWALGGGLGLAGRHLAKANDPAHAIRRWLAQLWPLLVFVALGLAGVARPGFVAGRASDTVLFIQQSGSPWWPTAARPDLAWPDLALFAGIVLATANLQFVVAQRRMLRGLVAVLLGNAVILAGFGTVQKLFGLPLYFGAAISPNQSFFATFLYHNHWSAFTLLALAAGAGLFFHTVTRSTGPGFWRSPAAVLAAGALILAATLPLCASRSGTVLGLLLLLGAGLHAGHRLLTQSRIHRFVTIAVATLALGLVGAGIVDLARPAFAPRLEQTREQLASLRSGRRIAIDDRPAVYRATLRMFAARPLFGWGPSSYGTVFPLYRTGEMVGLHYEHAHSDWLQSLAENGAVGTLLLLLLAAAPLRRVRWRAVPPLAAWLLGGCGLVVLYAALEFPFANAAVLATWWTLYFAAWRYVRLTEAATANVPNS